MVDLLQWKCGRCNKLLPHGSPHSAAFGPLGPILFCAPCAEYLKPGAVAKKLGAAKEKVVAFTFALWDSVKERKP